MIRYHRWPLDTNHLTVISHHIIVKTIPISKKMLNVEAITNHLPTPSPLGWDPARACFFLPPVPGSPCLHNRWPGPVAVVERLESWDAQMLHWSLERIKICGPITVYICDSMCISVVICYYGLLVFSSFCAWVLTSMVACLWKPQENALTKTNLVRL